MEMYKLLVVDDEPIIVDGLYELFKELKSYQLDVYKAYSGAEALEWLNKKRIDVVITDIKMPGIDGMQLLDKIHYNWPGCKVIFLTGHDAFEYVYKAIQHEGVKYLLKTESYESIVEIVENYLEQIGQSMKDEELLRKAHAQMQKAGPILQKEFLIEAIEGEAADVRQQQLNDLQIPLQAAAPLIMIAGTVCEIQGKADPVGKPDLYAVNYVVERHMAKYAAIAGTVYRNYILWFLQTKEGTGGQSPAGDHSVHHIKGILESVQSICRETLHLPVSFVISGKAVKWEELSDCFTSLKAMLNFCSVSGMEAVLVTGSSVDGESGMRANMNRMLQSIKLQLKKLETLETYMEQGRKAGFLNTFREIKEALAEKTNHTSISYEVFYSLSLLFISYMNRHGISETVSDRVDYDRLTQYNRFTSLEDALEYMEAVALHIFEIQNLEQEKRSAAAVQRVQKYIQDHPEGDLSLSSLADMVFFNPKYLSRLFKQVTGMNMSDYISEVKLNLVKDLLKQNSLKIHEIAEQVGYFSAPYFTRFFKRATSMTPQEYRDASQQVDKR
jgi:two-component system, response regulator YesN